MSSLPLWQSMGIRSTKRGEPVINIDAVLKVLEVDERLRGHIWYDEFHTKLRTSMKETLESPEHELEREFTDVDAIRLTAYMQGHLGLEKMSVQVVKDGAKLHAYLNRRNEPKEWLDSLVWDQQARLDGCFSAAFGTPHSMYARAASKNFFLSLVARIYDPGCQVDNMIVLEGPQGIGKTRALRAIGGKWYVEQNASPNDRDFYLIMKGKWLIEVAELDSFNRAEVTKIKSVITCKTDNYRTPYDTYAEDHPRMSVFAGTTNETQWVKDQTGARRFWPILCDLIDVGYLESNRNQLFAEAVSRFKAKENWYEMPESAHDEQETRRMPDVWEEPVKVFLESKIGGLSLWEIARDSALEIDISKFTMQDQKRLASAIKRAHWKSKHTMYGNLWYPANGKLMNPMNPAENDTAHS